MMKSKFSVTWFLRQNKYKGHLQFLKVIFFFYDNLLIVKKIGAAYLKVHLMNNCKYSTLTPIGHSVLLIKGFL